MIPKKSFKNLQPFEIIAGAMNRKLLVALALIVIGLIVAYRSQLWEFDWHTFFNTFRDVQVGWLVASVLATFLTYWLRAIRWQALLGPLKAISINALLTATLIGFSAIYVVGRAAEVVRPVWLTRQERVPFSASAATIIVERFLDMMMLVLLFAGSLLLTQFPARAHVNEPLVLMKNVAWILVFSSIGTMVAMFFFRSNIDRIVGLIPVRVIASMLHNFAQGLSFLQGGRSFSLTLVHSVILWIVTALQFWFMLLAMKFQLSFAAATLVMVGAAIGSIAQVPGIGGGFQAGLIFCLGTFFAIPAERSAAASLVAWVSNIIPTIAVAGLYMLIKGISFKELRGLETT
jgi:uncharacterized protein (TIRG00374 family)